jgi:hypothetical protein
VDTTTTSAIVFLVVALGVLLVIAYFDKIDHFMERTLSHKSLLHGMDLRDILLVILSLIFAGLGSALFVLKDWAISLSFALMAVVIIVLIMNLRHKSESMQPTQNLSMLIKSAAKEVLKEDREENIASLKDAFKKALKEDREETDNSKRDSQ